MRTKTKTVKAVDLTTGMVMSLGGQDYTIGLIGTYFDGHKDVWLQADPRDNTSPVVKMSIVQNIEGMEFKVKNLR
jgi:hypothetical protein